MTRGRAPLAREGVRPRRYRGDPLTVEIEALTQDGRGVCRVDGKAVFVSDALPGETVRMQPLRRRKGHDEAELLEVITPAATRVQPGCAHFGNCGGCALQHLAHAAQIEEKQTQLLSALSRIGKVTPDVVRAPVSSAAWAYRRRARLGVRWVRARQRVLVGFRERAGSYIADMTHCEVLAEPCRDLPGQLADVIGEMSIRERLPQVEVTVADNAVALVFRILDEPAADDLRALEAFGQRHDYRIYLQSGGPDSVALLYGDAEPLFYRLEDRDITVQFEPTDFVQVNAGINAKMVNLAIEALALAPGHDVLDLFCGLGNFSLAMARDVATVTGVEGEAALTQRAAENARLNGIGNVSYHTSNLFDEVGDFPWSRRSYDRVLLDPPRAGARAMVQRMRALGPTRVVYVSCHPGTLARDASELISQGFKLSSAGILDMFPHTAHVESMAVFDRA